MWRRGLCVCRVVKYPSQSKSAANVKDTKLKVGDNVNSGLVNNKAATETDVLDKSPYLQLLTVQEVSTLKPFKRGNTIRLPLSLS